MTPAPARPPENPPAAPYPTCDWEAGEFRVGSFRLEGALRSQLSHYEPLGYRVSGLETGVVARRADLE